jgi:acyl-CoA thioesterase
MRFRRSGDSVLFEREYSGYSRMMHELRPALKGDDWLLYRAEIDQAADGYGQTSAGIWTAAGELIALSRQTVIVFG